MRKRNLGFTVFNHEVYSTLKFKNFMEQSFFNYCVMQCGDEGKFKKSIRVMAEETGLSNPTVDKIINALVESGFVIKLNVTAEGTTYFVPLYKKISKMPEKKENKKEVDTEMPVTNVATIIETKIKKADDKIEMKDIANNKLPDYWIKFKKYVFEIWAPNYPKRTNKIKLENDINDFIQLRLTYSREEFDLMFKKICAHTKWYIANQDLKYMKSPSNYFLDNKFEESTESSKPKSTVMNKGFNSNVQIFETTEEIQNLFKI